MELSVREITERIVSAITEAGLKYEANDFSSGAVMIDIWKQDVLIVVQLTSEGIGLSVIGKEPPAFDTRPELFFNDFEAFNRAFTPLIENPG